MPSERVLIVEQDPGMRASLAAQLCRAGYSVMLLDSQEEILRCLEAGTQADLVLTGILPAGHAVMRVLEQMRDHYAEVPVVVLTSVNDLNTALTAIRCGAYDYLIKPCAPEQLQDTLRRALEHRRVALTDRLHRQSMEQLVQARTRMLRKAVVDLERSYDVTLETLGDALDLRDAETQGHSKRVTAYTLALARAAGVPARQRRIIARGAFLHDIGKIAVPDAILLKPGKLNDKEMAVMREHCSIGHQMLRKIPFLQEAAEIVLSHQERFDGTGYPRGLRRDQIPIGARLFAIADTMDAITSERPYRKARSFDAARAEIERCSGTQFDPAIVAVYCSIPEALWCDLRTEIMHHAKRYFSLRCSLTAQSGKDGLPGFPGLKKLAS